MTTPAPTCNACTSWWRLPLLLALVLAAVWFLRDRGIRETPPPAAEQVNANPAAEPTGETVSLSIDFGNGQRTDFQPIAWRDGMTVLQLTRETPRPDIGLKVIGTGESAFVANLDGVQNEGADGKNWTYSVDGKSGDRSAAIYELKPGNRVLWTFGKQR